MLGCEDPFVEESENIYKTLGTTGKPTQPLAAFVMHFGKECAESMETRSPSCRDFEEAEKRNFLVLSLPFLLLPVWAPGVCARTKVD